MIVYGAVLLAAVWIFMTETNRYIDRANLQPARLVINYLTLLKTPSFLRPGLLIGFGIGTIYALATILPFVLIDHVKLTPSEFGLGMMVQSFSFMAATIVASRVLRQHDAGILVPPALCGMALAAVAIIVSHALFAPGFLSVMLPVGVFSFSLACVLPAATTAALQGFPQLAGSASSLTGFLQFGTGILGSLMAAWIGDPVLALIIVAPGMMLLGAGLYLGLSPLAKAEDGADES